MSYFGFTPGFSDKILGDYMDGLDMGQSVPDVDRIEAEHFAMQMVGVAALMTVPVEEIGELEGESIGRDDLVCLHLVGRLEDHARKHPRQREDILERVHRILLRVADSRIATTGIFYEDLYNDLAWSFSKRGEHARAIDMVRRAVAHSMALDAARNVRHHLRDLARHTFVARPDEGAKMWAKIVAQDPTDVWTYVQLGHLGADVGLPELAHHARLRGIDVIRGRDDADTRAVRRQLERESREKIEARHVDISPEAFAELRRAFDSAGTPDGKSHIDVAHELVPDLASVPVKRRPTAVDVPPRESVLGALGRASAPQRSIEQVGRDLRSARRDVEIGPVAMPVRTGPKIGRNDPCPCGSGRKWKKCCGASAER